MIDPALRAGGTWRSLTSDGVGAAAGLAFDEAMMLPYGRERDSEAAATLRLYTYRPHCALIGRYQLLEDEVDLGYCEANGFDTGRRPTGGGAIIMGPDQLGVALATRAPTDLAPRQVLHHWAEGVMAGLGRLGVESTFRHKNDLEVDGRKIAGLGLYLDDRGALLFHASVLVNISVPLMLQMLHIPGAKLSDKAVGRVEERITTVSKEVGEELQTTDVRDAFAAGFAATFGIELETDELGLEERQRAKELERARYGNPEWIRQRSAQRGSQGSAVLKTPAGLLRFYVGVQGEMIKSLLVAGDFNAPPAGITNLETDLKWTRAEPDRLVAAVADLDPGALGVPPQAVAETLWEATSRALALQHRAHPHRREGACYAPKPGEVPESRVDQSKVETVR